MTHRHGFLTFAFVVLAASPVVAAKPSNDAAAFRTFALYADRTSSANTTDHLTFAGYPSSLVSPPLIMVMRPTPGSADTMALFNSFAKDAIYIESRNTQTSFSTYSVVPPQFATSLGTLLEGVSIFNGAGQFADYGKPLARATVTYTDGDTAVVTLHVGNHIRDYFDSGFSCNSVPVPLYTTRPSDPLSAYIYEAGGNYFDAQESLLPQSKRAKRVASIRIEGVPLSHFCNVTFHSGSRFSGFSIWPNFTVVNASSQPVVRQSQFTGDDHGGYMFGGTPVGTRRITNVTACQVASQAMSYTYAGFPATVNSINTYLQQNRGYQPEQVAIVTFVAPGGGSIRFTATGQTKLSVNDEFLVESPIPYTSPLATYRVTVAHQAASTNPPRPFIAGQATRVAVHNATTPTTSDPGRVYWNMKPRVADGMTSSPQLRTIDLPNSPQLADQVEGLLVQDIAVQLNVPGHFVVASGWTSSFRPDGSARGTYSIKDPFDTRNYTKLIEGKYRNTFTMARYVLPTGPVVSEVGAGTGTPGLGILASGAYRVEVTDPLGRRLLRDAGTGEGIYEIPDASIEDESSEHDNGGDVDDPLTGYDVEIPTTVDGTYIVRVFANDGLSLTASGYDAGGIFATADAVDTTLGAIGNVYEVAYSGASQSVALTHAGTVGVRTVPQSIGVLRVRHSPTRGLVEFVVTNSPTGDVIDVYEVSGRRVGFAELSAGTGMQVVPWDWRAAGCGPGVYLARLRSRGNETVRFVVLH